MLSGMRTAVAADVRPTARIMPRQPRSFEMGVTYHLISRFIERTWFITSPSERQLYLELQRRALERTDWRLLGYAIMSNHIHLVALAGGQPLGFDLSIRHSPTP